MFLHIKSGSTKHDSGDMIVASDKICTIDLIKIKCDSDDLYMISCFINYDNKSVKCVFDTEADARAALSNLLCKLGTPNYQHIAEIYNIEFHNKCENDDKRREEVAAKLKDLFANLNS